MSAHQPQGHAASLGGSSSKSGYQQAATTDVGDGDYGGGEEDDERKGAGDETRAFLEPRSPYPPPAARHHRSGEDGPAWLSRRSFRTVAIALLTCLVVCVGFKFVTDNSGLSLELPDHWAHHPGGAAAHDTDPDSCRCSETVTVPQHFQTSPQLFAGPTATGHPAFLAQTVTINPSATYVANQPLQTNIAVDGQPVDGQSIFQNMGWVCCSGP